MDCRAARQLMSQGVRPGSSTSERAQLGFHLARCAECRAYQTSTDRLLATLLVEPAAVAPAAPPISSSRRLPRWVRYAGLGVGALALALLLFVSISAVLALLTIRRNVQAMIIPTVPRAQIVGEVAPASATQQVHPIGPVVATDVPPATAIATPAKLPPTAAPMSEPGITGSSITLTPTIAATAGLPALPALTRTITPVPLPGVAAQDVAPQTRRSGGQAGGPRPASNVQPAVDGNPSTGGQAINVLLLGIDRRPDEVGPARTDALIIARLEPDRKRIALLSLPRDLVVNIPGYGYGRINAAAVYGELYPALGGGTALARQTVSELLGIPIDYVVQVDFHGFIGALDAIGGVTIDVPVELYDPSYPTMDYGYTVAHFLPGSQHMDGATALMYSRMRHMDSDFERMRRQQSVLVSALNQVREQNPLAQLQSLARITEALRSYIQTDLSEDQMINLAWSFRDIAPDAVERFALDGSMVAMNVIPGDPYAEVALPGAIEGLVMQLLGEAR